MICCKGVVIGLRGLVGSSLILVFMFVLIQLFQLDLFNWVCLVAIPYLKNPSLDPQFRIYFSKEWYEALRLSVRNFFSEIFSGTHILLNGFFLTMLYKFSLFICCNCYAFVAPKNLF